VGLRRRYTKGYTSARKGEITMATGSASKLTRWRRCRKKAWYKDMKKIQRKVKSIAPTKGSLIHACLEEYYKGGDWTKPIKDFKPENYMEHVFDEERAEWVKLQDEAYRIMRGYIAAYKQVDSMHKTLTTEVRVEFPIRNHTFKGTIDRIYVDSDNIVWIQDHKTASAIPQERELYLDFQTLMYFEACKYDKNVKKLIGNRTLGGVIFNHIRTKAPREPKLLKNGSISKAACDTDVHTYFSTVKKHGLNPDDYVDMLPKLQNNIFYKRTKIPINQQTIDQLIAEAEVTLLEVDMYKRKFDEQGEDAYRYFTRTMLKNRCSWDCEYYPICVAELAGMKTETILHDEYEPRDTRYDDEDFEEGDDEL